MDPQLSSKTILLLPISNIRINTRRKNIILLFQSDSRDIALRKRRSKRVRKDKEAKYNTYKLDLTDFAISAIANDLKVIDY